MFLWLQNLPLVRRERRNGSNSSYNCTPFLHSLLTKCKKNLFDGSIQDVPSSRVIAESPRGRKEARPPQRVQSRGRRMTVND